MIVLGHDAGVAPDVLHDVPDLGAEVAECLREQADTRGEAASRR